MENISFEIDSQWVVELRHRNGKTRKLYDSPTEDVFCLLGVQCEKERRGQSLNCLRNTDKDQNLDYRCSLDMGSDIKCYPNDGSKLFTVKKIATPFAPDSQELCAR